MNFEEHLQRFLSLYNGVKRSGNGWAARCPVPGHGRGRGDIDPSLYIWQDEYGNVWVKCNCGCEKKAVVGAVGWTIKDLSFKPYKTPHNGRRKARKVNGAETASTTTSTATLKADADAAVQADGGQCETDNGEPVAKEDSMAALFKRARIYEHEEIAAMFSEHEVIDNTNGNYHFKATCPACGTAKSLSVKIDAEMHVDCAAKQCDPDKVAVAVASLVDKDKVLLPYEPSRDFKPYRDKCLFKDKWQTGTVTHHYHYQTIRGMSYLNIRRFKMDEPDANGKDKGFNQQRIENGECKKGKVGEIRRTLYRLPRASWAAKNGVTVYITEGEKDSDNLYFRWRLTGTCIAGGTGSSSKWTTDIVKPLAGADVVILLDNDTSGERYSNSAAKALRGVAKSIRMLKLPGLKVTGDVSDWMDAGGTLEQFLELVKTNAEEFDQAALPAVVLNDLSAREIAQDTIKHLARRNDENPYLFRRGGRLVRIRKTDNGKEEVQDVDDKILSARVLDCLEYVTKSKEGKSYHNPQKVWLDYILHGDNQPFPELTGITTVPLLRQDGTVVTKPGYDAQTGFYYSPTGGLKTQSLNIPENPTSDDVDRAKRLIFDDLLHDFPFDEEDNEASKANAVALLLTPLLRQFVNPAPLALVDAPKIGTGKSLLAKLVGIITVGRAAVMSYDRSADEVRKSITALLADSEKLVVIDNITRPLRGGSLASMLTASTVKDRILGFTKTIELRNDATWVATGNNLCTDAEIGRRSYLIRMDAKTSEPQSRTGFKHSDIEQWTKDNRAELLSALFTLIRYWHVNGRKPDNARVLGSFEAWTQTVGGILQAAGIDGFLGNQEVILAKSDTETPQWTAFLSRWHEEENIPNTQTVAELKPHLETGGLLDDVLPGELSRAIVNGKLDSRRAAAALRSRDRTRYGKDNYYVENSGTKKRAVLWTVRKGTGDTKEPDEAIIRDIAALTHDSDIDGADVDPWAGGLGELG